MIKKYVIFDTSTIEIKKKTTETLLLCELKFT